MPTSAGYSGTPLVRKLGIKECDSVLAIDAPEGYRQWIAPIPDGVTFAQAADASVDIAHLFVVRRDELAAHLRELRAALSAKAVLWVSWPKKASKLPTDITEDTIRALALPLGFVDVKVCAVTEVWSGLKLVVRKELR